MKAAVLRQPDDFGGFDDGSLAFSVPPPTRATGPMGRVYCSRNFSFRAQQLAHHFTETVAAVSDRQQRERVIGPRLAPSARNGFGRGVRGERALEFVRGN